MSAYIVLLILALVSQGFGQGHNCEDDYQEEPDRIDCFQFTEESCRGANCTWCPTVPDTPIPWCYVSSASQGYQMVGEPVHSPDGKITVQLQRSGRDSRWENHYENLILEADFQSNERLRVKIVPSDGPPRFEVPLEIFPAEGENSDPLYDIEFSSSSFFSFKIIRKTTEVVLFDTSIREDNFVYADQFISLSWALPSENVYGIGENEQTSFKHDFSTNKKYPLWARDHTPGQEFNIYGVQPYYTVLETDGNAHSVAIVNANAQEFTMREGGSINYVTIGGILDFYFFLGPTPEATVQQYTKAVGRAPMPPYWSLGFQLCRWGYDTLENMMAAVNRMEQYGIPQDVQYGDIDIMERALDFTYSMERFGGLPQYIMELKSKGIKFVTIVDPAISIGEPAGSYEAFDSGQEMDVWVKRADGSPATGRVWPEGPVYFPDFTNSTTKEWWVGLIEKFHTLLAYDGLWIDMNEPANFEDGDIQGCDFNNLNSPPYIPSIWDKSLVKMTLCGDAVQSIGKHYDVHSLYGWSESEPTLRGAIAGTGKRTLVLSRSTFLGSGRWAAHWLGDNFSQWSNMHFSIIGILQFNHFGIPMVGADICGFLQETTEELCLRWHQLGAFYPFSRNHNILGTPDQDPGSFGPQFANVTRDVLLIRYNLLPYLYTLFHHNHMHGSTVVRALWHLFPRDQIAAGIDRQFMWGNGLLISPVLGEGETSVAAYFPDSVWYSYYDGGLVGLPSGGGFIDLPAPIDHIPLHLHGGNILPTQEPARNTEASRNNPFGLIVALDSEGEASGSLFYDDGGETVDPHSEGNYYFAEYNFSRGVLTARLDVDGYRGIDTKRLDTIRVMGQGPFRILYVNGFDWLDYTRNPTTGEINILHLQLPMNRGFTVTFQP